MIALNFDKNRNIIGLVEVDPEELKKLVTELEETRKQLNQEISESSARAIVFARQLNDLIATLENYATSEDIENLKNQLEEQSKFLDEQVNTITTSIVDLEVHKANLSEKLEALNASDSGTQEEREQLESEIESLQNQLDELNSMEEELKRISLRIRCMEPQRTDICETLSQNDPNANQGGDTDPATGGENSGQGPSSNNHTPGSPFYAGDSGAGTSGAASQGVANPVEVTPGTEGGDTGSAEAAVDSAVEESDDADPAIGGESSGQGASSNNHTPGSPFYAGDSAGAGTSGTASQGVANPVEVSGTEGGDTGSAEAAVDSAAEENGNTKPATGENSSGQGQGPSSNNNTPGSPFYATGNSGAGASGAASQGALNPVEVEVGPGPL